MKPPIGDGAVRSVIGAVKHDRQRPTVPDLAELLAILLKAPPEAITLEAPVKKGIGRQNIYFPAVDIGLLINLEDYMR